MAKKRKPAPKFTDRGATAEPEVKPDLDALANAKNVPPPPPARKFASFRMNGGSINPTIDGKRVNIRAEKVGVEEVPIGDGNRHFVDVYAYMTDEPAVIAYLQEQGYKEG